MDEQPERGSHKHDGKIRPPQAAAARDDHRERRSRPAAQTGGRVVGPSRSAPSSSRPLKSEIGPPVTPRSPSTSPPVWARSADRDGGRPREQRGRRRSRRCSAAATAIRSRVDGGAGRAARGQANDSPPSRSIVRAPVLAAISGPNNRSQSGRPDVSGLSLSSSAAPSGVPNIAPSVPDRASPTHAGAGIRGTTRNPIAAARPMFTARDRSGSRHAVRQGSRRDGEARQHGDGSGVRRSRSWPGRGRRGPART